MSLTDVGPSPHDACQATNQHYDLPAEYFAAYLDSRLKYSSGWYSSPSVTLDEAQTAKLRFVARQLGISGGEPVLDVGCGWGSLVMLLATDYGCTVTGITPSATQAKYVNELAGELGVRKRVRVIHGSFAEAEVGEMRRVGFEDIRESICRWPLGDPMSGDFAYCGLKSANGRSYCAGHCRMAYQPPESRARRVWRAWRQSFALADAEPLP